MKKLRYKLIVLFSACLLVFSLSAIAQPGGPPGGDGGGDPVGGSAVPLDGGFVALVIAAGSMLVAKKKLQGRQ